MAEASPQRIWLIAEHAHDEAARILRSSGAHVTVTTSDADRPGNIVPRSLVIACSKQGRALTEHIGRAAAVYAGRPDVPSIAICVAAGARELQSLLRAGLRGVVLRSDMSHTLLPTVAAVASGQVCLPSDEVIAPRRPVLSVREKQVMGLVARGLMNAQIAERLFLAESTVKSHLTSAFAKLGVRSRHEAIEVLLHPASAWRVEMLSPEAERLSRG